jgi:hypothetical protein
VGYWLAYLRHDEFESELVVFKYLCSVEATFMQRFEIQVTQLYLSYTVLLFSEFELIFVVLAADDVSGFDKLGQFSCTSRMVSSSALLYSKNLAMWVLSCLI